MKLGLITDIHEHVDYLRAALFHLRQQDVDEIVVLGDLVQLARDLEETCELLVDANAIGVWGNHDIGLCCEPCAELREQYAGTVLEFMTSLEPRLEIDECHFTHVQPWLNPEDVNDIWHFESLPTTPEGRARIFAAVPHRYIFIGHFHRWLIVTEHAALDWAGDQSIHLPAQDRYFVVLGPLCAGSWAIFDTEEHLLSPFNMGEI